jgi:hypothetical protein
MFFLQFIVIKYHKFTLYAHNLSSYDGILILESLAHMCEENNITKNKIWMDKTK